MELGEEQEVPLSWLWPLVADRVSGGLEKFVDPLRV